MKFDPWHLVWLVLLGIAIVLCYIGYFDGNWISPHEDTGIALDVSCGPIKYCILDDCSLYGGVSDIPFIWWKIGAVCMGLGIVVMMLGFLGALFTMFAQSFQPLAHNVEICGGVLALAGLICMSVGMKDMGQDDTSFSSLEEAAKSCKFCNDRTSLFYLVDCNIDDGFIMMIIGVIVECIAGCVGWNVNHRKDAPQAYRERTATGRSRRPGGQGQGAGPRPHVVGDAPPRSRWNAPRRTYNKRSVENPVHDKGAAAPDNAV